MISLLRSQKNISGNQINCNFDGSKLGLKDATVAKKPESGINGQLPIIDIFTTTTHSFYPSVKKLTVSLFQRLLATDITLLSAIKCAARERTAGAQFDDFMIQVVWYEVKACEDFRVFSTFSFGNSSCLSLRLPAISPVKHKETKTHLKPARQLKFILRCCITLELYDQH